MGAGPNVWGVQSNSTNRKIQLGLRVLWELKRSMGVELN